MIDFLKKYWLSTFVILVIFILCLIDTEPFPAPPVVDFDKLVHVLMFLGLSGVIFFDSTGYLRFPISKIRIFSGSFVLPVFLGGLIEILQENFTKTRTGDWLDFLYDVVGAAFGWGIVLLINHWLLKKKKSI